MALGMMLILMVWRVLAGFFFVLALKADKFCPVKDEAEE